MITVFGSINLDISVAAPRLPAPGETVLGGEALLSPGGKGANQAHAAQRAGAQVNFYGAVGNDSFAAPALHCMKAAGVDTSGVDILEALPTGLALIVLDRQGENSIVVAPGANLAARAQQVPDRVLRDSKVLLLQLETEVETTMDLAARARKLGCTVILNASPLDQADKIDPKAIDILIVNHDELIQLSRRAGIQGAAPERLARTLAILHAIQVVVTLGEHGALLAHADGSIVSAPSMPVSVVDTTGAGDTFAGVFAAAVAGGTTRLSALEFAIAAAGLACTRRGAQAAQPMLAEIEQALAS